MAAKFSMFQLFIKILAIFLFVEAYHCRKDNACLNKSAYNVNILDNPFNLKENKLLSISEAKCHSTNDYIENRQTSKEDVTKLMIKKLFKKMSILKKLDKHCEKKLFKAFSEIHNTMRDDDINSKISIKNVFKNVFSILAIPIITYLVGILILKMAYEWEFSLTYVSYFFFVLPIFMLIYIFVKILKRNLLKKGIYRATFRHYIYALQNIFN
ncbi:Plasmodium exported protein, unknown function [Plasmodium gonderi]|uniref:Variable surface protein n=1 Tax=Plasmodium gonderi TaxID=77519 RepID=A0A1Y1JU43_PLAGO|nr:Plasmodium exported protein, unknown function [Plasmodium gonderi]GAW84262.1 Plasmodium exported protein, unknown function [Plasmodium gonderi]